MFFAFSRYLARDVSRRLERCGVSQRRGQLVTGIAPGEDDHDGSVGADGGADGAGGAAAAGSATVRVTLMGGPGGSGVLGAVGAGGADDGQAEEAATARHDFAEHVHTLEPRQTLRGAQRLCS